MEALSATFGCSTASTASDDELDSSIHNTTADSSRNSLTKVSFTCGADTTSDTHADTNLNTSIVSNTSNDRRSCIHSHLSAQDVPLAPTRLIVDPSSNQLKAGQSSPSQVFIPRKLSTAIATRAEASHPTLQGRPTVLLPSFSRPPSSATTKSQSVPATSSPVLPSTDNSKTTTTATTSTDKATMARAISRSNTASPVSQVTPQRAVAPLPQLQLQQHADDDAKKRIPSSSSSSKLSSSTRSTTSSSSSSAPLMEQGPTRFQTSPSPLRSSAWSEPSAEDFNIRSKHYMTTKKKVPSEPSAFRLLTVDLINVDQPLTNGICAHPHERFQQALQRQSITGQQELPEFVFAINLCIPYSNAKTYHCVFYYAIDNMEEIRNQTTPFSALMNKFIFGNDNKFRNSTFKLIPRIVEGNYLVRKAVGTKPSILGKKIRQHYFTTPNSFEIMIDIASDTMAQKIVKLVLGYTKSLVVDMMFVLEGHNVQTLPERILGGVRMNHIDFKELDGKRFVVGV